MLNETQTGFILNIFDSPGMCEVQCLEQLAVSHNVDSVVLAIVKEKRLDRVHAAKGRVSAKLPDRHTIFQAASLTKPFFSYIVFKLIDQEILELDAPVFHYLPPTTQEAVRRVLARSDAEVAAKTRPESFTIRMLLNHTGGLPHSGNGAKFISVPGTLWEYSSVGFYLLQEAVEMTTGEPLNQLAGRFIFKPLGMHRSSLIFNSHSDSNVAIGTAEDGTPVDPNFPLVAHATHSLTTTAEDYAKFLLAVLSDERMLQQITSSIATANEAMNFRWGLGWGVEVRGCERLIWQWGNFNGYRAFVMGSLQTGDGFVMLTNSANGLSMAKPLAEHLLLGEHPIFRHEYLS